jgi:rod shape-determining protein MreD
VLASFVQGPIPRLVLVGMTLMALQQTLFLDLRPAGVTVQLMLALAAATGAAAGPQKGALAGFALGLMYDLRAGTPVGSSSLTMGLGGWVAGYSLSITVDPQWWLAALFTGLGTAVGETAVPVVRAFIGDEQVFSDRWYRVVVVVTAAAMVASPVLCPLGRWCVKVKRTDWTKVSPRPTGE